MTTTTSAEPLSLGTRVLYTIVLAFAFWLVCWALILSTALQLLLRLIGSGPNEEVVRFGRGLARYARHIILFLTGATDIAPFPFSGWPDVPTQITKDDLESL
jgi:hypothetical protein